MNWIRDAWTWADHLVQHGDVASQSMLLIILVLGVVLLGSWVSSRLAL
jgi:hypothetical protein